MFWPTVHLNKAKLTSGHWLFQVYGIEKRPLSPFTASAFTQKTSHTVKTFDLIAAANARLNVQPMCKLRSLWIWRKPEAMIQNNMNFQLELTQGCGLLSCEAVFLQAFFIFLLWASLFCRSQVFLPCRDLSITADSLWLLHMEEVIGLYFLHTARTAGKPRAAGWGTKGLESSEVSDA